MYKEKKNYENLQKMIFDGVGQYQIPEIQLIKSVILFPLIMQRVVKTERARGSISL